MPSKSLCLAWSLMGAALLCSCVEATIGKDCADGGRCEDDAAGPGGATSGAPCLGTELSCEAPEHRAPSGWYATEGPPKPGDAYPKREPVWERPASGLRAGFLINELAGDSSIGLFFLATNLEIGQALVGRLDKEATVLEQHEVTAPAFEQLPERTRAQATAEEISLGSCLSFRAHAGGLLLRCLWEVPCGEAEPDQTCGATELLSFAPDVLSQPIRIFPELEPDDHNVEWARARDGSVWEFKPGALRKYDHDGKVVIHQSALAGRTSLYWPSDQEYILRQPIMAVAPNDDVVIYARRDDGPAELWRFDGQGSPLQALDLPFSEPTAVRADRQAAAMLFSLSTWGDLVERRVARDEVEPTTRSLRRTGFYDMYIGEISEDAAGNFYVLTESGSGSRPSTTVCEFHGGVFEKQCYDIGPGDALAGTMVAGGEHTLFMLANPTGLPSGSGMARFELSH